MTSNIMECSVHVLHAQTHVDINYFIVINTSVPNKTVLRERKPPPTPKFQLKVIRAYNLGCQINPDPDVCWISPKMFWIHYLVGVSHFAKFHKNWAVTVQERLINLLKSPIPQC